MHGSFSSLANPQQDDFWEPNNKNNTPPESESGQNDNPKWAQDSSFLSPTKSPTKSSPTKSPTKLNRKLSHNQLPENMWDLTELPPVHLKLALVDLSIKGKVGEFRVYRSKTDQSLGLTVKSNDGLKTFHITTPSSGAKKAFALKDATPTEYPSLHKLVEALVSTSTIDSLGVRLVGQVDNPTPGTRPFGEVVQNPLFGAVDDHDDNSKNRRQSIDQELEVFENLDGDGYTGATNGGGSVNDCQTDVAVAQQLENAHLSRLNEAETLFEVLYGSAATSQSDAKGGEENVVNEKIRSIQRDIAIVKASVMTHKESMIKSQSKRKKLEGEFVIKRDQLRDHVMRQQMTEAKFAASTTTAAQLATLDESLKGNLIKRVSVLKEVDDKIGLAEATIDEKQKGLIKLEQEGELRKASLSHDKAQINNLMNQLRNVTISINSELADFKRAKTEAYGLSQLLKSERERQQALKLSKSANQQVVNSASNRMHQLQRKVEGSRKSLQDHRTALHSLRADEMKLVHQLEGMGHFTHGVVPDIRSSFTTTMSRTPSSQQSRNQPRTHHDINRLAAMQESVDTVRERALAAAKAVDTSTSRRNSSRNAGGTFDSDLEAIKQAAILASLAL